MHRDWRNQGLIGGSLVTGTGNGRSAVVDLGYRLRGKLEDRVSCARRRAHEELIIDGIYFSDIVERSE